MESGRGSRRRREVGGAARSGRGSRRRPEVGGAARSATKVADRVRSAVEAVRRKTPPPLLRIVTGTTHGLQDIEPFDRAMTLAAQAFTSVFPLIIAVAALLPSSSPSMADRISDGLGLPDSSRATLELVLPTQPQTRGAFGFLGVIIVVIGATSLSRALTRMYAKVWRVPPSGGWTRGWWRWVAVLFGVALSLVTVRALYFASHGHPYGTAGSMLLTFVMNCLLWTWAPWLLLTRQISWRRLLPGGVLMGLCAVVTSTAGGVYLPRALASASRQFGALGVAFTYIGWLFVVGFVLVCSTVLGAVFARDESRFARLIVGERPGPAGPD
jgi:membrane protein